jgi:transposase
MVGVQRQDWSRRKRSAAITFRKLGYSYRQIASKLGGVATHSGDLKLLKRYEVAGSIKIKPGRGRKTVTTPQNDRMALQNRKLTAMDIKVDSNIVV